MSSAAAAAGPLAASSPASSSASSPLHGGGGGAGTKQAGPPHGGGANMAQQQAAEKAFPPEMRDRQARGRDPFSGERFDDDEDDDGRGGGGEMGGRGSGFRLGGLAADKEPFAKAERRAHARVVLDSPELLMMYAHSSGDSIQAIRLRYTKILCGYDEDENDGRGANNARRGGAQGRGGYRR